jgi:hypothetical protein
MLTVHGARIIPVVAVTAVSIHSNNAKPRCRGLADFAIAIHSQVMRAHRKGGIGDEFARRVPLIEDQFEGWVTAQYTAVPSATSGAALTQPT